MQSWKSVSVRQVLTQDNVDNWSAPTNRIPPTISFISTKLAGIVCRAFNYISSHKLLHLSEGNTYSPYEVAHVTPFPNCSAYVTNNGHPLTVNLGCTSPPPPMLLPPPFGFKGSNMFISVEDQSSLHKQKFPHNCKTNFHHSDMSSLVKVPYCSRWGVFDVVELHRALGFVVNATLYGSIVTCVTVVMPGKNQTQLCAIVVMNSS